MYILSIMSWTDFDLLYSCVLGTKFGMADSSEQPLYIFPVVHTAGSATVQEHRWGHNMGVLGGPFDVIVACGKHCTINASS